MRPVIPLAWKDGTEMMFFPYDVDEEVVKQFHLALVTHVSVH